MNVEPDENCYFYPETGHRLCFGFHAFWETHGGLPNMGYPISEEFDEQNAQPPAGDGQTHTVQYFERARFEWHPEYQGTEYEVLLGLLGTEYLQQHPAPAEAVARQDPTLPPFDQTTGMHYGPHAGYGFNIAWKGESDSNDFQVQTLDKVKEAGFNWIRVQVSWDSVEPAQGQFHFGHLERVVDTARDHGAHVLVSIVRAPTWATGDGTTGIPADPTPFQNTMQQLSSHFNGQVAAWDIWNEENLAFETGGNVDIGRYVGLLKAGYTGVKAGDPQATVVFGGLTPTGVDIPSLAVNDRDYLQRIYEYNGGEVRNYFDALGAHPGSNDNSPDQSWPNNPGTGGWDDDNSFYFRRIEDLRAVMVANGDAHKQIWLTEFGWSTLNAAPGYEYGAAISPELQAQYLVRAFEIGKWEWPWVGPMFVWNLNFQVTVSPDDEKAPWGVLNPDWSPRPAYDALKNLPK
jgi:hypothetical protein